MRALLLLPLLLLSSCTGGISNAAAPSNGVVVSVSSDASNVGARILARGGNAVDAAVATAFALAVTFPEAGNIGGGGFMLIHFPDGREPVVIDYREAAPAAVDANTFFKNADRTAYRLVGVPGTVRGLALAHEKYGKLPWRDVVSPAIALARDGFVVNRDLAGSLGRVWKDNPKNAELRRVFAPPDAGGPSHLWTEGDRLVQGDLARTLEVIAKGGADAFYTGPIADKIVAEMERGKGLLTRDDLAAYRPVVRAAIHGTFNGYDVYAPPPPSSGGVGLIEMLNLLEHVNLKSEARFSSATLHFMTEAMRRAYADRARYLGDMKSDSPILAELTSKEYARRSDVAIRADKVTRSADLAPEISIRNEPEHTTHFSVIDSTGLAVSNTYTLEQSFGGKIVVAGAGFLLNNELADFNPQPGVTTKSGQIGSAANLPAAGNRPLSSMCPTIVTKDGKVVIVTGSPGGRTIINTVLCVLVNRLVYEMPPRECIDAPRHHHQWFPDQLEIEPGLAKEYSGAVKELRAMGVAIDPVPHRQGDAHSIFYDAGSKRWIGVADRRRAGGGVGTVANELTWQAGVGHPLLSK